jgi:hypothetical protein
MVKTTDGLNLAIDGRIEYLSWRGDPVNNGALQPLGIVSASSVDSFLYLWSK